MTRPSAMPAVLTLLLSAACAAPPPDATELLRGMQQAILAHDTVRYAFAASEIAGGKVSDPILRGRVTLSRLDLSGTGYRARMVATGGADASSFHAVKGVEEVRVALDARRVIQHASMYSAGSRLVARLEPGLLYAFFDPRSLDGELAAAATWEGVTEIGGESCDLVRVDYADDPEDSRWCIGRGDSLPRRLEWIEEESGQRLDLFAVATLESVEDAVFELAIPPGWTEERVEVGPARGTPLPDLTLRLAAGDPVPLTDLRGQVLVFDFWATWCAPCRASLAGLDRTAEAFVGEPVRFFAVNAMEDLAPGDPLAFAAENDVRAEVVLAGDALHSFFAAGNLPALAVVDAQGRAYSVTIGYFGDGSERYVRRLIGEALAAGG